MVFFVRVGVLDLMPWSFSSLDNFILYKTPLHIQLDRVLFFTSYSKLLCSEDVCCETAAIFHASGGCNSMIGEKFPYSLGHSEGQALYKCKFMLT